MKIYSADQLTSAQFAPQRDFCGPLKSGMLALLYANTGVGKSNAAQYLGYSMAAGAPFCRWQCQTCSVLHADWELPDRLVAKRLRNLEACAANLALPDKYQIMTRGDDGRLPNLSTMEGQASFERLAAKADVVIIDNLTTAAPPVDDRDGDVRIWHRLRPMLYRLRDADKLVIIIHHAGKSGLQLGTSLRENDMDLILRLTPSPESNKTALWLEFEKGRDMAPVDRAGLYLEFITDHEGARWIWDELRPRRAAVIRKLGAVIKSKPLLAQQLRCSLAEVVAALDDDKPDWEGF